MEANKGRPRAREFVANLAARGRYHFTSAEARKALGVSAAAAKLALHRLARQGLVASPARGFYATIAPEYRSIGCLPADQFIPALMHHFRIRYYAGLLSAAQYYGAAHQQPQEFQVVLEKARRPIRCGSVRVAFVVRKRLKEVPIQRFNTARGTLLVSSPEATALDLVGYAHRVGGLNQVVVVLSELGERIDATRLADAAATAPVQWAQRLGYLLDRLGFDKRTSALKEYVREHARESTALSLRVPVRRARRNAVWKLYVNSRIETEL